MTAEPTDSIVKERVIETELPLGLSADTIATVKCSSSSSSSSHDSNISCNHVLAAMWYVVAITFYVLLHVFTALHCMQAWSSSVRPSVRPSVCPSHACIVRKRTYVLSTFLYRMKGNFIYTVVHKKYTLLVFTISVPNVHLI